MEKGAITYLSARELAAEPWFPYSHVTTYALAKEGRIPHWKALPGRRGYKFPVEIIREWMNGEPVAEHWMHGALNIVRGEGRGLVG
ncbi:hypothetical protein [Limibacillus sp. MBR-115]|jgi:hypothetical protein|uniref:hypothetical protein n=1 Tax=Limibacillus sp. MBR-115 TaxID=3156465 RepID=UPI0033909599